jgi:ElaA protein
LYGILRLRAEVFVVEQECMYLDPDGRDAEPTAVHMWIGSDPVVAYLRVLREAVGSSIGRVVTDPHRRHERFGARLMESALRIAPRPIAINAQSRLQPWYAGFGFVGCGDEFLEDGIAHVPMVLT